MTIIDCQKLRETILDEVIMKVKQAQEENQTLNLTVIQVLGDMASSVYIKNKLLTAEQVGINCQHITLPTDVSFEKLKETIVGSCSCESNTAVMLQLPLPSHLQPYEQKLLNLIPWYKDVDGLSIENIGRLVAGEASLNPCTAEGVAKILPNDLSGLNVVLIGRSNLCNKPLIQMLMRKNATITICHSKTKNLKYITTQADIVICAIGKSNFFDDTYFNPNAIVIDIGMNKNIITNKLTGDVSIESLKNTNIKVTPTPKGTGILTTAQLMLNVVTAYEIQKKG